MVQTSSKYRIKMLVGGIVKDAGTYDVGTYGTGTYGQQAGEGTLVGTQYVVIPASGISPADPGWVMRLGDTLKPFEAIVANKLNLKQRINTDALNDAKLVVRQLGFAETPWLRMFELTVNDADQLFERTWEEGDIPRAGIYEIGIYLTFDSGRGIMVPFSRQATMQVVEAP